MSYKAQGVMSESVSDPKLSRSITPPPPGRIVLVTGDKGGTGKSTFARGLLDVYGNLGIQYTAYDGDPRNTQLHRHYTNVAPGVTRIDITKRGEADELLDDLEASKPGIVVVDLPAGSGEWFETFESDVDLIASAADIGYRLTIASVISRVKDSVNALRLLMNYCDRRVDYVVVKNLHFGEKDRFRRFDHSKTREQFLNLGGIEMAMADLFDDTYDLIDERDLAFRAAVAEDSPLSRANRSRLNQWLKLLEAEVKEAGAYLGVRAR
jgi:hypothetical protein